MRRVRVDHARARGAISAAAGKDESISTRDSPRFPNPISISWLWMKCVYKLALRDPDRAKLVELRFFAGLTMPKVAEVLGVSLATVERQWAYTKAWLLAELVHT